MIFIFSFFTFIDDEFIETLASFALKCLTQLERKFLFLKDNFNFIQNLLFLTLFKKTQKTKISLELCIY